MIKKIFSPRTPLQIAATTLVAILATVSVVAAATTLGTNLSTTGTFTITPASNSTAVMAVKNAAGTPVFEVDTTNLIASTTYLRVPHASDTTSRFNASTTAVSIGDGSPVAGLRFGTCVVNVPALGGANASSSVATCSATGVTSSDRVFINVISTSSAFIVKSASSTTDSIQIAVEADGSNVPAGGNPDASTWEWMAIR